MRVSQIVGAGKDVHGVGGNVSAREVPVESTTTAARIHLAVILVLEGEVR